MIVTATLPQIKPELATDASAVEVLLDHAFGPGRFTKVSERVREIAEYRPDLSFCAWNGGRLVGVVRQCRIRVGGGELIFLGPLAVEADVRKFGTGGALVERACAAAQAAGFAAVLLVGDEPYFSRFGFAAVPAGQIVLPGPVNPHRVLLRPLGEAQTTFAGAVVRA